MARMIVIYRTPRDPAAFDRYYFETHVPLAKKLPGLRKFEVNAGPVAQPHGGTPVHLVATLYFDDMAAIQQAFASAPGQACAEDVKVFAPDPASLQMLLFDDREV